MANSISVSAMTSSLRLNEPAVIADDIDGEIVIMNLERGSYYGLDALGADIWRMVIAQKTGEDIAALIASHFGVDAERVRTDVSALIEKMLENEVLVSEAGSSPGETQSEPAIAAAQYNPPRLTVYSDMKDLLAFDPPLPTYDPVPGK